MNIFKPNRRISLAKQFHGLRARFPEGKCYLTNRDRTLIWQGVISPTPFSRKYEVRIEYTPPETPDCYVLSPNLKELAQDQKIPHIYATPELSERTHLCLFLPRSRHPENHAEWRPQLLLSETMIPWASLWLFYFEQWLHTKIWEGSGAHPNPDDKGVYYEECPKKNNKTTLL
ncbi:hypothetical protein [Kosakonia sp. R1.Fl]|uniref:hypothetical protein n=1 Tax=Kosakonia sp. R1.Fl TaxID=2928706 RepID=UPI00201DABAC|nr:hypothetical protein [Kosakonia sp. R1.Fl]MCL6742283.1 hypothetical protein [Kosakonia sp. R1.Fl]